MIKDSAKYSIKAYSTNRYDKEISRSFKSFDDICKWCLDYLSVPNRKVVVYRKDHQRRFRFKFIKVYTFTCIEDLPCLYT